MNASKRFDVEKDGAREREIHMPSSVKPRPTATKHLNFFNINNY